MNANEINLQTLTDETFAALCHALLSAVHGTCYKPVAGEGGDSGIDGFIEGYSVIYQFKYYKTRPRPASFLKDIDKVAHLPGLKQWILLIPDDPTPKLYQLIANEKAIRSFGIDVLGKTRILSLLDKHKDIRERFFPQIAKETTVKKVLHLNEYYAQRHEKMLNEMKEEIKSKKPIKVSAERPLNSLTPEHIRDILDEIKRIEKGSNGKYSYSVVLKQLKNKYNVSNWQFIKDHNYGEIMTWLGRYYHGVKESYISPLQVRKTLQGVIKSQQKRLGLNDKEYRNILFKIAEKTSTTEMDIDELERAKDEFNILLGLKEMKR